jgi:hypothetical protein
MYARTIDQAALRLRELRREERQDFGLAAIALALAMVAAQAHSAFAVPLVVGGFFVGFLGVRALWRWADLIDRLAGERDAYVLPEVLEHASREATLESRHLYAALIRGRLGDSSREIEARVRAAADELEGLAADLDDETLVLEPAAAVACSRLLSDVTESPFLTSTLSPELLRSRVRQIRTGFRPASELQPEAPEPGSH